MDFSGEGKRFALANNEFTIDGNIPKDAIICIAYQLRQNQPVARSASGRHPQYPGRSSQSHQRQFPQRRHRTVLLRSARIRPPSIACVVPSPTSFRSTGSASTKVAVPSRERARTTASRPWPSSSPPAPTSASCPPTKPSASAVAIPCVATTTVTSGWGAASGRPRSNTASPCSGSSAAPCSSMRHHLRLPGQRGGKPRQIA